MLMARVAKDAQTAFVADTSLAPPLWSAIVHVMMVEIRSGATDAQARGFFRSLGQRIAAMAPVGEIESLDALSDHINGLWTQLGCGHVAMTLDDSGIDLRHDGIPSMSAPGDQAEWSSAIGPMLEGAYDSWFRAMGSSTKLHTRLVGQSGDVAEFRHAA